MAIDEYWGFLNIAKLKNKFEIYLNNAIDKKTRCIIAFSTPNFLGQQLLTKPVVNFHTLPKTFPIFSP